jgi:hypothetical protein
MKIKKCIKCGIPMHQTDWLILKEMGYMPICDNCMLKEEDTKSPLNRLKNSISIDRPEYGNKLVSKNNKRSQT